MVAVVESKEHKGDSHRRMISAGMTTEKKANPLNARAEGTRRMKEGTQECWAKKLKREKVQGNLGGQDGS